MLRCELQNCQATHRKPRSNSLQQQPRTVSVSNSQTGRTHQPWDTFRKLEFRLRRGGADRNVLATRNQGPEDLQVILDHCMLRLCTLRPCRVALHRDRAYSSRCDPPLQARHPFAPRRVLRDFGHQLHPLPNSEYSLRRPASLTEGVPKRRHAGSERRQGPASRDDGLTSEKVVHGLNGS